MFYNSKKILSLYQEPYDKGVEKGLEEGREEGIKATLIKTNIRLLTKKFGPLPAKVKNELEKLDIDTLEVITDSMFEFESLDDIKKYIS